MGRYSEGTLAKMRAAALGRKMSPESRRKMSEQRKGRRITDEQRRKISASLRGRPHSPEHNRKVAEAQLGQKRPPIPQHVRDKISASLKQRNAQLGRHYNFGRSPPHRKPVEYNGIKYRSTYEVRFARMLDAAGVRFQYEPDRFDLGSTSYMPDFYLPEYGLYIEVKGWMTPAAERKIDLFREKYPSERLFVAPKEFFYANLDNLRSS